MARRHSSFLLRCWDLGSDGERIEAEHIQSGRKLLATSVAAATEWIRAHGDDRVGQQEPARDMADSAHGAGNRAGGED